MSKIVSLSWQKSSNNEDGVKWSEHGIIDGDTVYELLEDKKSIAFLDLKRGVRYNIDNKSKGYIIASKLLKKYHK